MPDPPLPTLAALRAWVEGGKDPFQLMESIGLLLHDRLDRAGYTCTPANAMTFASTGGDGVHFSLLDVGDGIGEDSPVVMTVPMASEPNRIAGENLRDFLSLGIRTGYFTLENLAYDREWPTTIEAAVGAVNAEFSGLVVELGLVPWVNVAERLQRLAEQFAPSIVFHDT